MVPTPDFFVGAGVLDALLVLILEARSRGQLTTATIVAVTGALVGGAIGMRQAGLFPHLDPAANPPFGQAWAAGARGVSSAG